MKKTLVPALVLLSVLCGFNLPKKRPLNVVFIGDSITKGAQPKTQSPPAFAGDFLQKTYGTTPVTVSNQGVSGYTTFDFLPPAGRAWKNVKLAATAFAADKEATLVFSIMLGTNDSAIKGPTGAPVAPDVYSQNLASVTDSLLLLYPGCRVVINQPIWYSENTHNRGAAYMKEGLDRLKSYQPEIAALVNRYHKAKKNVFLGDTDGFALFEHQYLTLFKAENGLDGVFYLHPNKEGETRLGELWAKAILRHVD